MIKALLSGWRSGANVAGGTLALTLNENSLRYVLASTSNERGATIAKWGTELRGNQTRDTFMKRVKSVLPDAGHVIAVLEHVDYQVLQLESPNVPEAELASAIRWSAMELIEGTPHDYTIDLLTVPPESGRAASVIAVVAHNDIVRSRMLEAQALGRPLSAIDVVETSQRNLLHAVLLAESAENGVAAALVASAGRALLVITVRGQLYFFRRFEFDIDTVGVAADEVKAALIGSGAGEDSASRSLLQLNRSLDLWDDRYPNLPLATLRVDAGAKTQAIVDRLGPETGVETRRLDLSTIFTLPVSKAPAPWLDAAYLPLLGALLRPSEVRK